MTDIPIIMSAPMVRALLAGRKNQTRRLAWRRCGRCDEDTAYQAQSCPHCKGDRRAATPWQRVKVGDRLWVRETHYRYGRWVKNGKTKTGRQKWRFNAFAKIPDNSGVYFVDEPPIHIAHDRTATGWHKRPAIHMPRWASRLTLVVTATKIERLNKINDADCRAEGLVWNRIASVGEEWWTVTGLDIKAPTGRQCFARLWSNLHGAGSWGANPEVVALSFRVIKQNIDAMPKDKAA